MFRCHACPDDASDFCKAIGHVSPSQFQLYANLVVSNKAVWDLLASALQHHRLRRNTVINISSRSPRRFLLLLRQREYREVINDFGDGNIWSIFHELQTKGLSHRHHELLANILLQKGMKWMHYYAYLVFGRMCSALMLIVVQQRYARFTMCPHIYNSWYRCFLAYRRHCLSSYIYFSYTSMMWQGGYLIYVLWLQCIGHADHKSSLLLFRVQLAALLSRYT